MKIAAALVLLAGTAHADKPVSFEGAVQLALANASDARVAQDEVARASALLDESRSTLRPIVGVAASFQQLEGDRTVSGRVTADGSSFLATASVSMPILDFRRRADVQRARDQLEVEQATAVSIRRAVAIQTGRAYLSVFASQRILEVAERARETAQAHVQFATQRTQGGNGTDLDIVRAQAELATDEANLATARTALVQAEESLGVITGANAPLEATSEPVFPNASDAVDARADIVVGKRRLSSAEWSRKAQYTEYLPTLSLNAQAFYDAPQIDPLPRFGFQLLATVALPLYDGGYRGALGRERDAVLAVAREQLAQTERVAGAEVRAEHTAVDRSRDARDATHRAADLAAKALDLANVAYAGGTGTSLEVIDAQRSARDAATQAVIADDNLRQSEFALLAASGRFPGN